MHWYRRHLLALALAAIAGSAQAQSLGMGLDIARTLSAGGGAPLDGFTTPTAAYSFRKLRTDYSGNAATLRRASDSATQAVGFVGSDFDSAAAATFCAATSCFVVTLHDQSGNARDLTNATPASQPVYVANCAGLKPCLQTSNGGANLSLQSGSITPATGIVSMSVVVNRMAGVAACTWLRENGNVNRLAATGSANQWIIGPSGFNAVASDAAWHAGLAIINGASSAIVVDGVTTSGSATGTTAAGAIGMFGITATTCAATEAIVWDNYVLTGTEQTALQNNQRDYWAPAPLDSFTTPSGAYSFRKLRSTYTGPALRIRRASDNAETDIGFLGFVPGLGAPWDEAAAAAHCAATSCFLATWYDQGGGFTRNLTQATPANQAQLVFNCKGSLPCFAITTATMGASNANVTPATGVLSISAVANRSVGTGVVYFLRQNSGTGNRLVGGAANTWALTGGTSGSVIAPAVDAAWHSAQGVINGASSSLTIDGTTTAGSTTGNTVIGNLGTVGIAATTLQVGELVLWDAYALTAGEVAALTANQKSFWGTP